MLHVYRTVGKAWKLHACTVFRPDHTFAHDFEKVNKFSVYTVHIKVLSELEASDLHGVPKEIRECVYDNT